MKLNIQLQTNENEHQRFIEALETIIDDIKGGYEKQSIETNVTGSRSIDPI